MVVYHYVNPYHWMQLKHAEMSGYSRSGLLPIKRLGRTKRAWWETAVFALTHPEPTEWVQNQIFPNTWHALKMHVGKMLLDVTIAEEDQAYVIEHGHITGYRNPINLVPDEFKHASLEEAEEAYIDSKIPLAEYETGMYSLPEVIIQNPVPFQRIRISDKQPLIDEISNGEGRCNQVLREELRRTVAMIPDLVSDGLRVEGLVGRHGKEAF